MTEIVSNEAEVNSDIEGLVEETATEETAELTVEPIPNTPAPTLDQINQAAQKAAIDATGTVHLTAIYQEKVKASLTTQIATVVSKIMSDEKRAEIWTREEAIAVWDRIEAELKAIVN